VTGPADPGKARRQARGIPIVAAFDGYRALAVVGVVLFHVFEVCGVLVLAGSSAGGILLWGVLPASLTVFFIVSGFVMFLPTAVREGDFGSVSSFAIGRAARLLPPYWLTLVVAVLLLATFGGSPGSGSLPGPGSIIGHLTLTQTPALLIDGPVSVNGVSVGGFSLGFGVVAPVWTLSVETFFYLVLPLIAASYFRRPFVGLATAAALVIGWHFIALNIDGIASAFGIHLSQATEARFNDYYASQFPTWALALAAGMTIAWLYVRLRDRVSPRRLEQRALWATAASLPAIALLVYLAGHDAVTDQYPLNGLFARQSLGISLAYPLVLAAAMLAFSLAPRRIQRPIANEPIRGLADISYTIYLIHFAVIWLALRELSLPRTGSAWSAVAWSAVVFPAVLIYGYMSARFFERPIRRWANRYRRRAQSAASPGIATAHPRVAGGAETPPVSVVIPTYDRAAWLPGAIDSVLAQDYPNLELLVVDDGSTDETPAVLTGYAERHPEKRFRFLRQANAGQAEALNRGNALARGEIIGYLADDDALAPGAISRLAGELIARPEAAVAYPGYWMVDEAGVVEDTILPIEYSPLEALCLHDTIIGPGGLARRRALESAGGWDPNLHWLGDLILWMGIGLAGPAIRVAEPLASWRRHSGSATTQLGLEHAREHLRIVERGLELEGLPAVSRADRAEALRNACMFAAFSGAAWEDLPKDRFAIFDREGKRKSAFASGQHVNGEVDWAAAEESARLHRELVLLTLELAERRAGSASGHGSTPSAGGLEDAVRRLRGLGALAGEDGSFAAGAGGAELQRGLVEAAFACGAEVDPRSTRFIIIDRHRLSPSEAELGELGGLGFRGSAEQIRAAVDRRRRELDVLKGAEAGFR
jgi:peptidoglycan/LPS O-acetylase OafA/YrhL